MCYGAGIFFALVTDWINNYHKLGYAMGIFFTYCVHQTVDRTVGVVEIDYKIFCVLKYPTRSVLLPLNFLGKAGLHIAIL